MRLSKSFLSLLLSITIVSCASVPDVVGCRRRSPTEGFCTWTITDRDMIVNDQNKLNGKTWLDLVIEGVYIPADSWKEIKKYIIKQCKKNSNCAENISTWERKLNSLDN